MLGWKKVKAAQAATTTSRQPPPLPVPRLADVLAKLQQLHHHNHSASSLPTSSSSPPPLPPSHSPQPTTSPSPPSAAIPFPSPPPAPTMLVEHRRSSSELSTGSSDGRRSSADPPRAKAKKKKRWYMLGAAKDAKHPSDDDDDAPPSPHPQHSPSSSATSASTTSSPSHPAVPSAVHSTPPSSSSSSSMSFFKRNARTSESSSVGRAAPPPPISTSFAAGRSGKAQAAPTLKLPMAAIVARPAFASSFRSFLVSKYCQENIDFLLAVERWTKTYEESHPNWRRAHSADDDGDRGVYAASIKDFASVDLAHDKSGYVSLDLEHHEPSSPLPPPSPAPVHTNLPRTALEIYHTYILLTGAQTVNIPAHTRLLIEHTVAALQASASPPTGVAERTPLSALLTPALFDDAVYEIQCLLEREWLTKYYATSQYAMLVQLMDKRERHSLLKEEAARAKAKLHQQLKRVAATVQGPPGGSPSKAADEPSVHVRVEKDGAECRISAGFSPLSPPSPVSSLRPSEVRQAGRLGEPRRRKEVEEEKTQQPDSAASSLEWSRDLDSPSPLDGRASSRSSVSLLTPPSASRGMFHPVSTPHMHLSPRKAAVARKVVVHADDDVNASVSYASLPSSATTSASSTNASASSLGTSRSSLSSPTLPLAAHSSTAVPTSDGSSEIVQPDGRRSFLVTPVPYPHDSDDEERVRAPFATWSSADDDAEDAPAVFITHHDKDADPAVQDDDRLRKGSDSSQPDALAESPEPSTASPSPSPVMNAWPESSRSGEVRKEEGSGSEADPDENEDDQPLPEDGSGRFFSVQVAEDDSDNERH